MKYLSKGWPILWFAIVAFILFGQSLNFDYTYLDDQTLILSSLDRLKSPAFAAHAFSEDVFHNPAGQGFYYRPMLTLSFMADAIAGKGSFAMFHFTNIVYHILATFLLFLFFVQLGYDRMRAFLFSLVFLVHPMVTQAVAWVPGRNDTLLAIFIFGSFITWLKFLNSGHKKYLLLHLLLFLLALLTKENAIVLPVLVIFFCIFILHTPLKKFTLAGAGWVVISIAWMIMRSLALGQEHQIPFSEQLSASLRNLPAILPFTGKIFIPLNLSVFPILTDMKISMIYGLVAVLILAVLIGITRPKQWNRYGFGALWFLAFLLPSFVALSKQVPNCSEHRSYLAMAGIFLLVMETGPVKKINFSRLPALLVMTGLCLFFSILTFLHTRNFIDRFSFWQNAVETSPSYAFNFNNLGAMYYLQEDLKKAEPLFRQALAINPYEPMVNSNIGLICMRTDRPAEAEIFFLEEIRINPSYDHVYFNLGLLYYNHGRHDEGISQWEKTLSVNPGHADAIKALLFAYQKSNRKEDYERIERIASDR